MPMKIDDFEVSDSQIEVAKDCFKKFDKKSIDKISSNDLGPAFTNLKLTVKGDKLKEWADMVDSEATGYIDIEGFLYLYGKKLKEDTDYRELLSAFKVLDKQKKGEISTEDLRWILENVKDSTTTSDDIDDMIRNTDIDGSGSVDFDEFYKLMTCD
ncbi:20 kDa calcium-binding protein-like [Tubulanus polymorphus]|uniref:20 kDa calcium-binding protein-like n=1 Tax=Tubulanus polymorphus TaxID=672921 RepID=UPI003DA59E02